MVRESKMREQNDIEREKAGDSAREQKQQKKLVGLVDISHLKLHTMSKHS